MSMRDLTEEEHAVVEAFGAAFTLAAKLPKVHQSDLPELVHHTHACQNIILARPGYQAHMARFDALQ